MLGVVCTAGLSDGGRKAGRTRAGLAQATFECLSDLPRSPGSSDLSRQSPPCRGRGVGGKACPVSRALGGASVRIPCKLEIKRARFLLGALLCLSFIVTFPV